MCAALSVWSMAKREYIQELILTHDLLKASYVLR
jgi:hypothetical protein